MSISRAARESLARFRLRPGRWLPGESFAGLADEGREINRVINFADVAGELALEVAHAGAGGGGDDDLEVGKPGFEGANEMGAKIDFADANGVNPEGLAVGDGLFELGVVKGKALAKTRLPVAPPPHPQEIVRGGQEKKHRKQYVVKETHLKSSLAQTFAPYFRN